MRYSINKRTFYTNIFAQTLIKINADNRTKNIKYSFREFNDKMLLYKLYSNLKNVAFVDIPFHCALPFTSCLRICLTFTRKIFHEFREYNRV